MVTVMTIPIPVSPSLELPGEEHCLARTDLLSIGQCPCGTYWDLSADLDLAVLCPMGIKALYLPFVHMHGCRSWGSGAT